MNYYNKVMDKVNVRSMFLRAFFLLCSIDIVYDNVWPKGTHSSFHMGNLQFQSLSSLDI